MKTHQYILPFVFSALLGGYAAESKIPLAMDYPAPAFQGTPKPLRNIANLEPRQESARVFLVPPRTTLLSRGKRVTSSDPLPVIGEFPFLNDGDKTGIDGTVLELGPGPQWVQIDLGAAAEVMMVAVWHFHAEFRVYHDVIVQISDDPEFRKNVTTVYNSDDDNSSKLGRGRDRSYIETCFGRLIDAKGVVGRYVRLHSNGNTSDELNHYAEVEIYGRPVGGAAP